MNEILSEKYKVGQRVFIPRYGIARIESLDTENISGTHIQLFRLVFDNKNYIFSAQANLQTVIKVPVFRAESSFIDLPTRKQFQRIIDIATADAQTTAGRWKHHQEKFEDALKSGDLKQIANIFRKTKMDSEQGTEPSYSKQILYEEALKTLCATYAEVFQVDFPEAMKIFVAEKPETAPEPQEDNQPDSPSQPQITERISALGPQWDIPITSALRISTVFSQKARDLIIEKLPCKSLSELYNLTKEDWPLHAPATAGISVEDARAIQSDTQALIKHLSQNIT